MHEPMTTNNTAADYANSCCIVQIMAMHNTRNKTISHTNKHKC